MHIKEPLPETAADAAEVIAEATVATGETVEPGPASELGGAGRPNRLAPASKAARNSYDPAKRRLTKLVDTEEAFEQFAKTSRAKPKFTVDLETTSLDAVGAEIVGWAFSWQPRMGYYLPVRGPAGQHTLDPDR